MAGRWLRETVGGGPPRVYRSVFVLVAALTIAGAAGVAQPARAAERSDGLRPAPTRLVATDPAQESGREIGFIEIPAIGLSDTLRAGVAMSVIDLGPAHWAGTSLPGGPGNVVIAGHRTTKTRPFYYLNRLKPGDAIVIGDGTSFPAVYRVTEAFVVAPEDIWITYETGEPIVTLFACHPRGSARHRIVVRGALRTGLPIR